MHHKCICNLLETVICETGRWHHLRSACKQRSKITFVKQAPFVQFYMSRSGRLLMPTQWMWMEFHLMFSALSAYSIEKWHLKSDPSRNNALVTLDNVQTSLWNYFLPKKTLWKRNVACGLSRVAVTLTVESDVAVEFSKCKIEQMKFYSASTVAEEISDIYIYIYQNQNCMPRYH